ncbi:MAG: CHAT domain-containing protein [Chlorogloeopsis fritschii C42_A2020_084]|uniref:CHAT domain-containing protein n=1 Tax=Chlorogloeopsis fritschii TaxID=1124 RepID=UPI001A0BCBF3|nr:CHAT domain-containing protein [Chlorogloeopsis fritschii]MBF2006325.1 CHAT domain-containing protein [Chlorogloeopsis fritschii C42_A2020_084]
MNPSLNLAITHLVNTGPDNFAICVFEAPYPSGRVIHDCVWHPGLTHAWQEWQQMFALHSRLDISFGVTPQTQNIPPSELLSLSSSQTTNYTSRLMQYLGMSLWRWVFDGPILGCLERSSGIAMGQNTRLRFRLEIRDPRLIALPWEIMQREAGQSAMSLSQNILFSRTTSEVESLPRLRPDRDLNILLVLGEDENQKLQLDKEAAILEQSLANGSLLGSNFQGCAPCTVKTLLQPTPQQLIKELETRAAYNIFFYAGHGLPGPDGGYLFLHPEMRLNGMELAQVLTHTGVKLAVFNACWGAQPAAVEGQAIPSSSLAEVLIRNGVPAVLGMRDQIADQESHSFIQSFVQGLRKRLPIDHAVAEARQHLLTVYKFNQPAWTLPVLYLHPEFDGELLRSYEEGITELPETSIPGIGSLFPAAWLKSAGNTYTLQSGVTRIGRTADNDIVISEPSVSKRHAEILCRNTFTGTTPVRTYYLQEKSTYGTTWILRPNGWQQIHRQEVPLEPGMQLKFGSMRSHSWEFTIEDS